MPGDIMLYAIDPLSDFMSGVQVFGIGEDGVYNHANKFEQSSWLKTYHLTCMMGRSSTDGTANSTTLLRTPWRHVHKSKVDAALVGLQAQFNTSTLLQAGLRPNSQNAYLALCGRSVNNDLRPVKAVQNTEDFEEQEQLLSPWERRLPGEMSSPKTLPGRKYVREAKRRRMAPYVNALHCVDFDPPFFTIEIQVAHETLKFLTDLVANLGPKLRTATLLSKARRVRHGPLTAENSLLQKHLERIPIGFYEEYVQCVNDILTQYKNDDVDDLSKPPEMILEDDSHILKHLMSRTHGKFGYHVFENLFQCTELYLVGVQHSTEKKCYMVPINS
ncbi:unnamed protein product [Trichobilharzia szidati]|nr:unnamed protein product [Trichobilharzia szidati]